MRAEEFSPSFSKTRGRKVGNQIFKILLCMSFNDLGAFIIIYSFIMFQLVRIYCISFVKTRNIKSTCNMEIFYIKKKPF